MADWDYRPEEEQKEEKQKKYVTRKEFRICFVILLAAICFATMTIDDSIRQTRNELSSDVYRVEEQISNTINNIPRNIEQGIEDANNPIRESSMEIVDVDVKGKTATIRMTAAPKEYVDGMTVKFLVSCDGAEAAEVPAAAGADRVYTAELKVPYCGVASATAHLQKGNTEYICSLGDVYVESAVLPQFNGNWGGSVEWKANQDFVTFEGDIIMDIQKPEWMISRDKGTTFKLKNAKTEVYIDGKKVKTIPAELLMEDEYTYSYQSSATGKNKIKLGEGKTIAFIFKAEDNNGLKYSYLVEKGTWDQENGYMAEEPAAMLADGTDSRLTIE